MDWDIALAKKIKRHAAAQRFGSSFTGIIKQLSPLVVSAYDGEIMLSGSRLQVSTSIGELHVGDAVCVVGTGPYTVVARM